MDTRSKHGRFERVLVRSTTRVLVQALCKRCGASKTASYYDGTMQQWEAEHQCDPGMRRENAASQPKTSESSGRQHPAGHRPPC